MYPEFLLNFGPVQTELIWTVEFLESASHEGIQRPALKYEWIKEQLHPFLE